VYAGSGITRTLANLFPASDGYQAWAGGCADADPEGEMSGGAGAYWPGATRAAAFAMARGETTAGVVALRSLSVTVRDQLGADVAGATVVATHSPDQVCETGATHTLGVTDSEGELQSALPYGTWEISVTGRSAMSVWPTASLDPTTSTSPPVEVIVQ